MKVDSCTGVLSAADFKRTEHSSANMDGTKISGGSSLPLLLRKEICFQYQSRVFSRVFKWHRKWIAIWPTPVFKKRSCNDAYECIMIKLDHRPTTCTYTCACVYIRCSGMEGTIQKNQFVETDMEWNITTICFVRLRQEIKYAQVFDRCDPMTCSPEH